MRIWFSSDLHLGHHGVIGFCERPFEDISEMDMSLVRAWNRVVGPTDLAYLLGDVSFHRPSIGVPLLASLNGRKILVRGNHDKYSAKQYRDAGFLAIAEEMRIALAGFNVKLSHYPYWPTDEERFGVDGEDLYGLDPHDLRYEERRPSNQGGWLLCGHVHEKWKVRGRMINVGVDQWGYAPVPLGEIEKIMRQQ